MSWLKGLMTAFQVIKELIGLWNKIEAHVEETKAENKAEGIADLKAATTDEERLEALKKITHNT